MRIEVQPTANMVVDRTSGTRRALLRKFPQRILYLIEGESVVVFAIVHYRRDDIAWRERLV